MDMQLNNGVSMPSPGFGTGAIRGWPTDNDEVAEVVAEATATDARRGRGAAVIADTRATSKGSPQSLGGTCPARTGPVGFHYPLIESHCPGAILSPWMGGNSNKQ